MLPEGIGGKVYSPCEGQETVTFMAPPGGVVYVGSISFENNSGNLSFKITEDLDKAREFMKNEYPSLAEHIVLEKPSIKNSQRKLHHNNLYPCFLLTRYTEPGYGTVL